jgi:aldose 1-epimerase
MNASTIRSGDLEAVFRPAQGMLGASLRHRGEELLRRVEDLEAAAARGSTAGIPLLYPWANRLDGDRYRAAGQEVLLELASPLLHLDANGIPIHGVPWSRLAWDLAEATQDRIIARLDWTDEKLLALFPFRHRVEMAVTIRASDLTVETTVRAGPDGPVPVSFGFHPYFGLPGLPRSQWHLRLPAMRRLGLDARGIRTGADEPFPC